MYIFVKRNRQESLRKTEMSVQFYIVMLSSYVTSSVIAVNIKHNNVILSNRGLHILRHIE